MFVVNIILDIPLRHGYSYLSEQELQRGTRVQVELRGRSQVGFVSNCMDSAEFNEYPLAKLKPILSISADNLSIPNDVWELCNFAANYYHHPLGNSLFCAIPTLLRKTSEPTANFNQTKFYQLINHEAKLRGSKQLSLFTKFQHTAILSYKQIQVILATKPDKLIAHWLEKQIIHETPAPSAASVAQALTLNEEQQLVVTAIANNFNTFHVGLLYGITGSGKTEVFLHLIQKVLHQQQQVLVIVPEINLTPQLQSRFEQRFPAAKISLINSEIAEKARFNAWVAAKSGQSNIILGTRLSVFTPLHNIGLIIVDEEHDDSLKQNDGLRYHARDLAVWRAKQLNIPIVLASATPSLESLYNYKLGKYSLYKLTARAIQAAELPQIELINLQHYPVNHAGICQPALDKLHECLERKELALVFINRRGYAPVITCYECGWVSQCRNCSTNMVYHHEKRQLKCHHCAYQIPVPPICPTCHNQYLHTIGHGTQKLEEFLQQQFASAKIKRVDRDSTNRKSAWQEIYRQIAAQEIDILVGTQMLAKGHDFPRLTLVIGLNLDNALFSYDFRASEDMFNILTQVAGRAGRADKAGLVLLQTNYPDHPVYQLLQQHDFNGFINHTLHERQLNKLPPFCFYALIKLSSLTESHLKQAMHDLFTQAKLLSHPEVWLFAPVPAVMYKSHNRFRGQMLISSQQRNKLHDYLKKLENKLNELKGVSVTIDVDPLEV